MENTFDIFVVLVSSTPTPPAPHPFYRYMKYLYPYECAKRGLSSPGELQAAIDSNRREGRRQSYGSAIFNYSPVGTPSLLSSPKIQMSHLPTLTHNSAHIAQVPVIKKGRVSQLTNFYK